MLSGGAKYRLSKCSRDYALALYNPVSGPDACVPNYPAILSRRIKVKSRGSFTVPAGNTGIGFCVADPQFAYANNASAVIMSGPAYAQNSVLLTDPNIVQANSDSDYASASLGLTALLNQFRVTSALLRIRYRDTELNRGGSVYALMHPAHLSLQGQTLATIQNFDETRDFQNTADREWINCHWKPVENSDVNFSGVFPTFTPSTSDTSFLMGFLIGGDGAVATTYDYEFHVKLEVIGLSVRGKTLSHCDPTGFNAVHATSISSPILSPHVGDVSAPNNQKSKSFLSSVGGYLASGVSWAWNHRDAIETGVRTIGSTVLNGIEDIGMGLMAGAF